MLNTVSNISLMRTEVRISLTILIILNPLKTDVAEEKLSLKANNFMSIPRSEAMTMSISN